LMVDGTGYGFRDRYALKWFRGTEVRLVQSHVRLVLLVAVDDKGKAVVLGGAVGPPYASEVELLRRILARKGDRIYDSRHLRSDLKAWSSACYSYKNHLALFDTRSIETNFPSGLGRTGIAKVHDRRGFWVYKSGLILSSHFLEKIWP